MATEIALEAIPNQTLSIQIDDNFWGITLQAINGSMVATITRNGANVIAGMRCVAGSPLLPYNYMESGNFIFLTADDELPDWQQFNVTQSLVYLSTEELAGG